MQKSRTMRVFCFIFCICISVFQVSKGAEYPFEVYDHEGGIGGGLAVPGSNPYQVAILRRLQFNFDIIDGLKFVCGGSLIAPQWVLTAAQCIKYPDLKILLGVTNIRVFEKYHESFDVTRENMIVHPKYKNDTFDNDIALIKLPREVTFNHHVQPIRLSEDVKESYVNRTVFLSGWSRVNPFTPVSDYLRQSVVKVISNKDCQNYFTMPFAYIGCGQLCTTGGSQFSEGNSCSGDPGSPLTFFNSTSRRLEQIGIVSRNPFNCVEGPTVYAKIVNFKMWIDSILHPREIDNESTAEGLGKQLDPDLIYFKKVPKQIYADEFLESKQLEAEPTSEEEHNSEPKQADSDEENEKEAKQIDPDRIYFKKVGKQLDSEEETEPKQLDPDRIHFEKEPKQLDSDEEKGAKQLDPDRIHFEKEPKQVNSDEESQSEPKQGDTDEESEAKQIEEDPNSEAKQAGTDEESEAKQIDEEPNSEAKQAGTDEESEAKQIGEEPNMEEKQVDTDEENPIEKHEDPNVEAKQALFFEGQSKVLF